MRDMIVEAHAFLQQQGCINVGIPHGEAQGVSDEKLKAALFELLEEADLDVSQSHPSFPNMILMQLDCNGVLQ